MFKILLGFLPWILYFVLVGETRQQHEIAIAVALISTLVLDFSALKKGFILSWGTVVFFVGLLAATFFVNSNWLELHTYIMANSALAAIVWISLIVNVPFTLQYAREQVPQQFWHTLIFVRINQFITLAWGISFSISVLLNILQLFALVSNGWVYQVATYIPSILAIIFTKRFPGWYRQYVMNAQIKKSQKPNPFLQGNFAPVHDELNVNDLQIEGTLPADLSGTYMRNGPNPKFTPFTYNYPFDGDGMLHAVYLKNGKASYKNKFIQTAQLKVEERIGEAVYGGVNFPYVRDRSLLNDGDPQDPVKIGRFIHIVRHANQYLALHETTSAYQVDAQLNTIGEWNPLQTAEALQLNAHTRLDPDTGELFTISYHEEPRVTYNVFDKNLKLINSGAIDLEQSVMIHDFVLTKNYVVIFLCPVVVNFIAGAEGKQFGEWRPELKTKIVLLDRKNLTNRIWLETKPFFSYHYANAFESENEIIVDHVFYDNFNDEIEKMSSPYFCRTSLNLKTKACVHEKLDDREVEFPRINEAYNSKPYRYAYVAATSTKGSNTFDALIQYDLENNKSIMHDFGSDSGVGEPVFVAKQNPTQENDGYVLVFVYNKNTQQSELAILDAQNFAAKPLAKIKMPRRVPYGLHGSWFE